MKHNVFVKRQYYKINYDVNIFLSNIIFNYHFIYEYIFKSFENARGYPNVIRELT